MFWKVHAGNYGFFSDSVSGDAISFYCCYALPQTSFKLPSLVCAKHHEHENRSCWNKTPWSSHAHNFFLWKTGNNRWTKPEPPLMLLCPSLEGAEHLDWWQCYHCPQRTDPRQHRAKGAGWDPNREKEKKRNFSSSTSNSVNAYKESLTAGEACWNALHCYQLLSVHSSCPEQLNVVHSIKQKLYVNTRGIKSEQEIHFAGKFIDFFYWSPVVLCCSFWRINSCFTEEIQLFRQNSVIV